MELVHVIFSRIHEIQTGETRQRLARIYWSFDFSNFLFSHHKTTLFSFSKSNDSLNFLINAKQNHFFVSMIFFSSWKCLQIFFFIDREKKRHNRNFA